MLSAAILIGLLRGNVFQVLSQEYIPKNLFSYLSTKTYVVGTQKNCLNETFFFEYPKHI